MFVISQSSASGALEPIDLSSINNSSCKNTESIRDDPYWTSRKNSLELIELSSINNVLLVKFPPIVTLDQ
jgi:hypothetical protein